MESEGADTNDDMSLFISNQRGIVNLMGEMLPEITKMKESLIKIGRRLDAIDKKIAEHNAVSQKKQGPEEWRSLMRKACSDARGTESVSIPWDKIDNRAEFEEWFETVIKRIIVDDKVGPYIELGNAATKAGFTIRPSHPSMVIEFLGLQASDNYTNFK